MVSDHMEDMLAAGFTFVSPSSPTYFSYGPYLCAEGWESAKALSY